MAALPPDELAELVRALVPQVLSSLLRRGEGFAAAEDAIQDAVIDALRVWPACPPRDPRAWLTRVAQRRLVDARRSESARRTREDAVASASTDGARFEQGDDTLLLLFLCCHPELSPASQVALTLRAVAGLTTREIADAFFVPEATMAQRISRAKRTLRDHELRRLGDLTVVLRVLALIYRSGHGRRHDVSAEAIRLTRQLALAAPEPEARGLLALMLLQRARLAARTDDDGRIVTLDEQDRTRWDRDEIAEGVAILQGALAEQRHGRYQIQAAIAALHADAPTWEQTDWVQILAWYDDLVALSEEPDHDDPAAVLNRAIAVAHVHGARRGLAEIERVRTQLGDRDQWHAVRAYLCELADDHGAAAAAYAEAATRTQSRDERDHFIRRVARARARRELAT